jgi:hypothetical protein
MKYWVIGVTAALSLMAMAPERGLGTGVAPAKTLSAAQ